MNTNEVFSKKLKTILELKKIKPSELSKMTGIPKSGISQYLSGKIVPKYQNLDKIAKALNVSTIWFMQ